jgi:pimeloyl-ACP methyl ester carboxylesterase
MTIACRFLALFILGALTAAADAPRAPVRNVVLVHGAWADGSSWAKVIPIIEKAGLHVVAVQNPLTSFADDVAAVQRAIALEEGRVLLVGHSYGGVVITEAGADAKVAGLVYVAAFAPDAGQGVLDLGKDLPPAPGGAEIRPDKGGFLKMTSKGIEEDFAQDLPKTDRRILAATQGPTNGAAFGAKVTNAAWKSKPTWYVVASNDRMIQPDLERQFAKTMGAKTITVASSHVPMLSHAPEVARLIIDAAKGVPVN